MDLFREIDSFIEERLAPPLKINRDMLKIFLYFVTTHIYKDYIHPSRHHLENTHKPSFESGFQLGRWHLLCAVFSQGVVYLC